MRKFDWSRAAIAFLVVAASVGVLGGSVQATKLGDVDVSGYVDVYGATNLNRPAALGIPLHLFEGNEAFSLNRAEVVFDSPSFRADLGFGPADGVVNVAPGAPASIVNLQQAYIKWPLNWMGRDIAIDAGKFVTHMGFEVIESKDNWLYSRGLLFQYAIPYYHTGIRAATAINDKWGALVSVVSGWNNVISTQRGPALGLQVSGKPLPQAMLYVNYITGSHIAAGSTASVVDIVLMYDVNKSLSLGANIDSGSVPTAGVASNNYTAWAVYGKYAMANGTVLLRYESFDDPAVTGAAAGAVVGLGVPTTTSLTLGYDIPVASSTTARVEYRMDGASTGTPFATSGAASASQSAITAALVTTF